MTSILLLRTGYKVYVLWLRPEISRKHEMSGNADFSAKSETEAVSESRQNVLGNAHVHYH